MADYYNENAAEYFASTVNVDMHALRERFLTHLPARGHILDAGCGSGRDSLAFLNAGYRVTAFDAAPKMAALAEERIGQSVEVLRFQDVTWSNTFDGIWACASLLHVPRSELPDALQRLERALKPGGILYVSFKYGDGEREAGGRRFTDLDETGLATLLERVSGLRRLEQWITGDQRRGRAHEPWFNALLVKD